MDNQSSPYSAYFKLYDGNRDNLQVAFNVTGTGLAEFIESYTGLVSLCLKNGMAVEPAGLEEGERIQEVDGYVVGMTKKDEPCVYLYNSRLKWRVATVYKEKLGQLPFSIQGIQPVDVAPEREVAERRKLLHPCTIKVIMVDTGDKTEAGKPIWKFDRVYGVTKSKPLATDYATLVNRIPADTLAFTLVKWAHKVQENSTQPAADVTYTLYLADIIDGLLGTQDAGQIVLSVLTGLEPEQFDLVRKKIVDDLVDTLPSHILDDSENEVENPNYSEKRAKTIIELWLAVKDGVH